MTTETKRHIDAARQVLVGVVPNPTSQIDQITNALIYKFMDDMDQSAIKQGGEPSFFIKDLKNYAWTRLMDARMGNQERMNIYSEALVKFSESKQLPQLFREIFKSAFLPYRSPEVLGLFLKEISYFDYSHPEELGNAYEYLLSIMSSQGDAGQFRTPRHIIDFIVGVVNPTLEDKVLDPACGTGGFLVSAYKHILEQHSGTKEKPLTPDQRKNLMGNFEGYDVDPGMVRIAQVNMYLHQFKNPKIFQYDTLSMEERWGDRFSVIMANPPFMSPKGGVSTHSKFSIQSSRSEVLFVDYIMNHLRPNGRAGIIVPEGIIFQSGTSYKQLRKSLVEDGLNAVISLPSGVFQPYSGVKTSILLFDNELAKQKKEILFVKIENDGFDLGATKRPINKNDLPEALDILNKWKKGKKVESTRVIYVSRKKIAENGDYNLSGDRYRVAPDYTNAKWPMVELGEICEFIGKGGRPASFATENGKIPFIVSSSFEKKCDSADFDTEALIIGDGGSANIHYINGRFSASDHTYVLKNKNEEEVSLIYVYLLILNNLEIIEKGFQGQGLKNVSKKHLQLIQIPLPPLEIQEQIVAELDGYTSIITGAKQITQNWKPKINIDPQWPTVSLGGESNVISGYSFDSKDFSSANPVKSIKITNVGVNEFIYEETSNLPKEYLKKYSGFIANTNDIVISLTRPIISSGLKAALVPESWNNSLVNQRVAVIKQMKNLDIKFIYTYLSSDATYKYVEEKSKSLIQPNLSVNDLKVLPVPFPPLEIQKQIVEKIEAERALVESAKKLIEIYSQKTKETIAKLWAE